MPVASASPRSAARSGFVDHCLELLAPLGAMRARRMFGGHGIYADDLFIAIVIDDQLYLKSDAENRQRFLDAGCEPFRYERRTDGAATTAQLNFYQPPEEALESQPLMGVWGRLAMEAALRAANAKARKPAAKSPKTPKSTKATLGAAPPARKRPAGQGAATLKRSPGAGRKPSG